MKIRGLVSLVPVTSDKGSMYVFAVSAYVPVSVAV